MSNLIEKGVSKIFDYDSQIEENPLNSDGWINKANILRSIGLYMKKQFPVMTKHLSSNLLIWKLGTTKVTVIIICNLNNLKKIGNRRESYFLL